MSKDKKSSKLGKLYKSIWAFPPLRTTNDVPTPYEVAKSALDANLKPFFAHFNHQGGP